jgi:hypothetical protein
MINWGSTMSNVLIGIVGVILFIGLALAGATFFGPITSDSISQAKANTVILALATTVSGVATRNRELETSTQASASLESLVPDYIDELPRSPIGGAAVMLTSSSGSTTNGSARFVVTSLGTGKEGFDVCRFVNQASGNGDAPGDVSSLSSGRSSGCGTGASTIGPFASAEYVAFQRIR